MLVWQKFLLRKILEMSLEGFLVEISFQRFSGFFLDFFTRDFSSQILCWRCLLKLFVRNVFSNIFLVETECTDFDVQIPLQFCFVEISLEKKCKGFSAQLFWQNMFHLRLFGIQDFLSILFGIHLSSDIRLVEVSLRKFFGRDFSSDMFWQGFFRVFLVDNFCSGIFWNMFFLNFQVQILYPLPCAKRWQPPPKKNIFFYICSMIFTYFYCISQYEDPYVSLFTLSEIFSPNGQSHVVLVQCWCHVHMIW